MPEIRAAVREPTSAQASLRDGQMASRRNGGDDQEAAILLVVSQILFSDKRSVSFAFR